MTEQEYNAAIAELEKIEKKVSDPSTPLSDTDALLKKSASLIKECRGFLRTARETLSSID